MRKILEITQSAEFFRPIKKESTILGLAIAAVPHTRSCDDQMLTMQAMGEECLALRVDNDGDELYILVQDVSHVLYRMVDHWRATRKNICMNQAERWEEERKIKELITAELKKHLHTYVVAVT